MGANHRLPRLWRSQHSLAVAITTGLGLHKQNVATVILQLQGVVHHLAWVHRLR